MTTTFHQAALACYGNPDAVKAALRNDKAARTRHYRAETAKVPYIAVGGPFHDQALWLTSPNTGVFEIGGQRGYYRAPDARRGKEFDLDQRFRPDLHYDTQAELSKHRRPYPGCYRQYHLVFWVAC